MRSPPDLPGSSGEIKDKLAPGLCLLRGELYATVDARVR